MTRAEHIAEAERLLDKARSLPEVHSQQIVLVAAAQVHATLALAIQ